MLPDEARFASWQVTQASTILRAPLWKALGSVFEPEVAPKAPWQTLHFSVATMVRRGCKVPVRASSFEVCWIILLARPGGTTSGRGLVDAVGLNLGSTTWPM